MGVLSNGLWRRLWLALPLIGITLLLMGGHGAGATEVDLKDQAGDTQRVFMPHVAKPKGPPILKLVPFVHGFDDITITAIKHAGDERLFVAIREGKIWIVNPAGQILPTPFLDIKDRVRYQDNFEQGLLGLAFHPDYPRTPYYYIVYTVYDAIVVARGVVKPTSPNTADPLDLQVFIVIRKPDIPGDPSPGPSPVHNGGDLVFGKDGYLYIPLGDGGPDPYSVPGPGDPNNNSQRRDTLLGSVLRIDPNPNRGLQPDCGLANLYSIPRDNPYLNDDGCDEIWTYGLRNPWRMSIDPLNGDFYIADVGEWLREEVNYVPANSPGGQNFGWHCWEGNVDYTLIHPELASKCKEKTNFTFPVFKYDHSHGECSIIGGKVYRGQKYPDLYGRYFFGDWCTGQLWTMYQSNGRWQVDQAGVQRLLFSTFGEDIHGELYAGQYGKGILYKVEVR